MAPNRINQCKIWNNQCHSSLSWSKYLVRLLCVFSDTHKRWCYCPIQSNSLHDLPDELVIPVVFSSYSHVHRVCNAYFYGQSVFFRSHMTKRNLSPFLFCLKFDWILDLVAQQQESPSSTDGDNWLKPILTVAPTSLSNFNSNYSSVWINWYVFLTLNHWAPNIHYKHFSFNSLIIPLLLSRSLNNSETLHVCT